MKKEILQTKQPGLIKKIIWLGFWIRQFIPLDFEYDFGDVGRMIRGRQKEKGWGAGIIPRLSKDIRNELPEIKGFSERNIKRMTQFYREYLSLAKIGPLSVAQSSPSQLVQRLVAQISWAHNMLLIQQVKDMPIRLWYMRQTEDLGSSLSLLLFVL
jgi:hypothetical protein